MRRPAEPRGSAASAPRLGSPGSGSDPIPNASIPDLCREDRGTHRVIRPVDAVPMRHMRQSPESMDVDVAVICGAWDDPGPLLRSLSLIGLDPRVQFLAQSDVLEMPTACPDLVILDVRVEWAEKRAALGRLRQRQASVPALLVGADPRERLGDPDLDHGMDEVPEASSALRALVLAALGSGRLHRRLAGEIDRGRALRSSLQDGLAVFSIDGAIVDANERFAAITGRPLDALVGARPPFAFWPADRCGAYERRLREALGSGLAGEGDRVYLTPSGEERHVIVSLAPLAGRGADTAAFVSTVKDVSARRATEQMLRESEAAHRGLAVQQAALARVAAAVAAGQPPEAVFARVAEEVAALLGVEAGGVARFEPDGACATLLGAWTVHDELRLDPGAELPLTGESVTAIVHRTGRPARIDDYADLPADTLGRGHAPRRSSVAAPVRLDGRLWGTVGALSTRASGLGLDAEDRLGEFADLVALAIAGAEARIELTNQARTDALTGLTNRRAFDASLALAIADAQSGGPVVSVILADIDHFKAVNDTYGHQAGDEVLQELARRLNAVTRSDDVVARVGGEEFAWVIRGLRAPQAAKAAERLRRAVRAQTFGALGRVTVSIGVAEVRAEEGAQELLARADRALYDAKEGGRDRVQVAD